MWLCFWPKIKNTMAYCKIHAYDDSTCRQYVTDIKMQMEIVHANIDYLPHELNSVDIKTLMLNQKPNVYVVLDEFCEKYNVLIKSNEFLFETKKRPAHIAPVLFRNNISILIY